MDSTITYGTTLVSLKLFGLLTVGWPALAAMVAAYATLTFVFSRIRRA